MGSRVKKNGVTETHSHILKRKAGGVVEKHHHYHHN